jgi:tetratricopeptide (TPR) repeat protein
MMTDMRRSLVCGAAVIVLLTVLAYLPAIRGGFVFDDNVLIADNQIVRASDGLRRFWLTTQAADYYPLTWSLWWVEWRLWGSRALGYHVINVLLHAANAVLVWVVLRRLKILGAWLAGLVFAVHPVNVATVAWISEQKNTLSMLFYLVAVLLYLRFDEEGRWRWYGLSLGAFLLALLSKTAVVMLPFVLLVCVWWLHGKVRWQDFRRVVPFFVLSLVLALVTIWFQHNRASLGRAIQTASFATRLAAAGWVPWFYLYKALLPFDLTVVYPKWTGDATRWVSYVPGMILVGCFIVFWWKRKSWGRPLLFGLGYFVVTLFPVLGFFDQALYRATLVADHWQYYSVAGVIALAVAAGHSVLRRTSERYQVVIGAAMVTVLAMATWHRSRVYTDDETLWRDNVAKNPTAWLAHNNLGFALGQAGKLEDAIAHYDQALRLKPDYAEAYNNLGAALVRLGNVQAAMEHYGQALRIEPDYAEAHYNLGAALWQGGKLEDAVTHYEHALRIKPDYAEAHNNLAVALAQEGKVQDAIRHYE